MIWLLFAKKNNGAFILRIEDTDTERYVEGAVDVIYRTLTECGLDHDEGPDIGGPVGPYVQTERRGLYGKYAELLVEKGCAVISALNPHIPQVPGFCRQHTNSRSSCRPAPRSACG